MEWSIAAGAHRAVIAQVGGGLRGYSAGTEDYVDGYGPGDVAPAAAGQVLAPWPNRVRDGRYSFGGVYQQLPLTEPDHHNAIHGLVNWVPWYLVDQAADAVTVGYDLPPQPGYPFAIRLRTRWSVGPGGLTAEHEATNTGEDPAPFGLGSHPYLRIPGVAVDDLVLQLSMGSRLLTDGRLLPIGAARVGDSSYDFTAGRKLAGVRLDTTFGLPSRDGEGRVHGVLTAPDGRAVSLWAGESFRWLQVFTADGLPGGRDRRAVAIEPMTCPPDALRSGRDLVTIAPGESWRGTWGIAPGDTLSR
ncbi:aldose 1-epimerase family protein [Longispora albida]|uniref:aldose 1-epimerase family protein n=1 Tax=Longispora albida TaxID=203523 RepID=UPI00036607BC|nr:aldose 1-epimerase family protein [Longispora albida]